MLWTRSKTELPWGRKKAAVCVFLYPKTDCNSLTNSFSKSLPWSEWSVSGGPNTENTRSMKWRTVVRAALSLMGIKRQIEWNGRWQKGWSDFLVTNFYTRQDRQQSIGMRGWQGGVPQAIWAGGGRTVLARQTRFNMSTIIRGHSRPPNSVSNSIECCLKS